MQNIEQIKTMYAIKMNRKTNDELDELYSRPTIINARLFIKRGILQKDAMKIKMFMNQNNTYKLQIEYLYWKIPMKRPSDELPCINARDKIKKQLQTEMNCCNKAIIILSIRDYDRYPAGVYKCGTYLCSLEQYEDQNSEIIREERWNDKVNLLTYFDSYQSEKSCNIGQIVGNPDLQRYITEYV